MEQSKQKCLVCVLEWPKDSNKQIKRYTMYGFQCFSHSKIKDTETFERFPKLHGKLHKRCTQMNHNRSCIHGKELPQSILNFLIRLSKKHQRATTISFITLFVPLGNAKQLDKSMFKKPVGPSLFLKTTCVFDTITKRVCAASPCRLH